MYKNVYIHDKRFYTYRCDLLGVFRQKLVVAILLGVFVKTRHGDLLGVFRQKLVVAILLMFFANSHAKKRKGLRKNKNVRCGKT